MAKRRLTVGIDIGSHSVKVVELKETKEGYRLHKFGMALLPQETIIDGSVINSTNLISAIQEIYSSQRIKNKYCAMAISGHSIIVKKISVPKMTPKELKEQLKWEAEQYVPFDIGVVYIDAFYLKDSAQEEDKMDFILVAAKKDVVNDYMSIAISANLKPMIMDVQAFALQNAFEINYGIIPQEIALVNVGAAQTNINIIAGGESLFTRDISFGGNMFTEEIEKNLNVDYNVAEALKTGAKSIEEVTSITPKQLDNIIRMVCETLADEIQRSLDFYLASGIGEEVQKIYISGGSSKIVMLPRILEERLGIPVEVMNPFNNIIIKENQFNINALRSVAPMCAISVGLALRSIDEKPSIEEIES